jgi:cytochrome P450
MNAFMKLCALLYNTIKAVIIYCTEVLTKFNSKSDNIIQQEVGYKIVAPNTILVQSQSVVHCIFSKDITQRKSDLGLGDLFERWLGKCLGSLDSRDRHWGQLKKIFRPLFEQSTTTTTSTTMNYLINEWESTLQQLFNKIRTNERPISIEQMVDNFPLKFMIRLVFNESFVKSHSSLFEELQHDANILMFNIFNNKLAKNKFYKYYPCDTNNTFKRFQTNWNNLLKLSEKNENSLYHHLLENYKKTDCEWEHFSQTLIEVIFANQDVTNPSMCWLLTHYSLHPMNNEEHDVDNYIEEVGRLSPIFPTSMPRITTKDLIINDKLLKKGTTVTVDFVNIGKSEDWKMNDLDVFRPNRFNEVDTNQFINRFGFGSRKCPGRSLAIMMFRSVIEHIKTKWIVIPSHPTNLEQINIDPTKAFISPIHNVWLVPKDVWKQTQSIYYDCSPISECIENRFIAISINSRSPFLSDSEKVNRIIKYLNEKHSQNKNSNQVLILICDKIAHFNLQAFEHMKPEKALKEALKLGERFERIFQESIDNNDCSDSVKIVRWNNDYDELAIELMKNDKLDKRVELIASTFIKHRGQGKIDNSYQTKLELVKKYIYHEIPILLCGIKHDNIRYRLLTYSGTKEHLNLFATNENSLHNLVLDIMNKQEYQLVLELIIQSLNMFPKVPGFIGVEI